MSSVQVRYIVRDMEAALGFYTEHLGFEVVMHPAPAFAMLSRGPLRLVLSVPNDQPGGGSTLPSGARPEPGGWNRFALEIPDLESTVRHLKAQGVAFRSDIMTGVGVKQVLAEDPSGNPIELFEPILDAAHL